MIMYIVIALATAIIMVVVGFFLGSKGKDGKNENAELIENLRAQVSELNEKGKNLETTISNQSEQIKTLTSERDVQKAHAENYCSLLEAKKEEFEKQLREQKESSEALYEKQLNSQKENSEQTIQTERARNAKRENELKATFDKQIAELKNSYEKQITDLKDSYEKQIAEIKQTSADHLQKQEADAEEFRRSESQRNAEAIANMRNAYETQIAELKDSHDKQLAQTKDNAIKQIEALKQMNSEQVENSEQTIQTERERNAKRENELKATFDKQIAELKDSYEKQIAEIKQTSADHLQKQEVDAEEFRRSEMQRNADTIANIRKAYETQIAELKNSHDKQLAQTKDNALKQIEALKQMNSEQVDSQLKLIREQMQTTSEEVLKRRQEELGERNREQVSKIIDPLQQSLKDMQEAFDKTKEQQSEALTRLDETIKINMQKSAALGETADRLTRALTGEVKVQGNFGELKLKQLLEDLELKEGEQFDTQETLRDKAGNSARGDDGKGLIPDFILHFPNNRHVVVDSKMSLTDYERYMNATDGTPEKTEYLKAHIASVRAQVKRLAKKDYTKYLPSGYNKLNFAIMYVPIEGALNLALLNDDTLWREAYDQGVMILGPQTMYMNLRVLEMMWTQVRQLKNQQAMMDAANTVVDRVQDFGMRFIDVETSMNDTIKKITKLKITTADSGASIITAAKKLLKAGAQENKKKKSLAELDESTFIEADTTPMLTGNN